MPIKYLIRLDSKKDKLSFTYDRGQGQLTLRRDVTKWLRDNFGNFTNVSQVLIQDSWGAERWSYDSKGATRFEEEVKILLGFKEEVHYKWFKKEWADLWRDTVEIVTDDIIYKNPGESHSPLKGELLRDLGNTKDWTLQVRGARPMLVFGCKGKAMLFKLRWVNVDEA